jgi:hypothetical protein
MQLIERREFPASYDSTDNVAVDIPRALIPLLTGHIAALEIPSQWVDETDHEQALQAIYLLYERMGT